MIKYIFLIYENITMPISYPRKNVRSAAAYMGATRDHLRGSSSF